MPYPYHISPITNQPFRAGWPECYHGRPDWPEGYRGRPDQPEGNYGQPGRPALSRSQVWQSRSVVMGCSPDGMWLWNGREPVISSRWAGRQLFVDRAGHTKYLSCK
ncbi:hypothetical protein Y032_0816g2503 [Ancylostoma ceylanicum]|uniref:Uncharacterized protein n=1 Tax=Ancylostoma ceylanicum TaxID=53326 RepID=A0A016WC59_9BILA|nr:hypothetical protein Y032_0816g2503 [Ancylostoma ceylanicum]